MNKIYSTQYCPWCQRAKALLKQRGIEYTEIDVTEDADLQQEMVQITGRQTVPQIFFGDQHIGGYDDLRSHLLNEEKNVA
ncbi:MAG: glutaredoxin 3 [Gammaproteobacteria bacterium]